MRRRRRRGNHRSGKYRWAGRLIWAIHGGCLVCGTHHNLSVDHIVPFSKGGTNHILNLQTLCRWHNSAKDDLIIDFRPKHLRTMEGILAAVKNLTRKEVFLREDGRIVFNRSYPER